MVQRLQAIEYFLSTRERVNPIWNPGLETQVMVAQGAGEKVFGKGGARTFYFRHPETGETWFNMRIPKNAKSDDHSYTDKKASYDLAVHAEAIGSTGWNWKKNQSDWVGFDFDSLVNHSQGLTPEQIKNIRHKLSDVPWVTIRRSKSGQGIHVFVQFANSPTVTNHRMHAALARSVLHQLSALVGHRFEDQVDCVGQNMWLWHRDAKEGAFELLKQGEKLDRVPENWQMHVEAVSSRLQNRRTLLKTFQMQDGMSDSCIQEFVELHAKTTHIGLTDEHRRLIRFVVDSNRGWWDQDHNCLITHTTVLAEAHSQLALKGIFKTIAEGKIDGDHNCFAFPQREGWSVRRYDQKGVKEHALWSTDSSGWTYCMLDAPPDLETVIRAYNGVLGERDDYEFESIVVLAEALKALGLSISFNEKLVHRKAYLTPRKEKLLIKVPYGQQDATEGMNRWRREPSKNPKNWVHVIRFRERAKFETEDADTIIRAARSTSGFEGFYLRIRDGDWMMMQRQHLAQGIQDYGYTAGEAAQMLGAATVNPWKLVTEPFQDEYPGNRQWNLHAAQLAVEPQEGEFPTWQKILDHAGQDLDEAVAAHEWCRKNNIRNGADYIELWISCLFQRPKMSLPYLSFFSEQQQTGKSTIHEALASFFVNQRGYARAESALKSQSGFNGELNGAILCVIEEIDLSKQKYADVLKDWVTAKFITLHRKGMTPVLVENHTHWMQFSNRADYTPIFPNDTRIVMIEMPQLDPEEREDKHKLDEALRAEAPAFLHHVLNVQLPDPVGRLQIPVMETHVKQSSMQSKVTPFQAFIDQNTFNIPGTVTNVTEFYEAAKKWILENYGDQESEYWNTYRMSRGTPKKWIKGLHGQERKTFFGNVSLDPKAPASAPFFVLPGSKELMKGGEI